jgi:uncharacterized protein YndB with AHSA1/START domain
MSKEKSDCAEAGMLIRKPVDEVFEAFIDPEITKNFWFTKGSSKLETGKKITWEWEMYDVSATIVPKEILKNQKILFEWGDPVRLVELNFKEVGANAVYVSVSECGFDKASDDLLEAVKDSTGGFTTMLDGLKAFLEYGINLNLTADKFPKELIEHGTSKNE